MKWQRGLSDKNAVGGNGFYREGFHDGQTLLATCVWDGEQFREYGPASRSLWRFAKLDSLQRRITNRSWTGLTVEDRWTGGGQTLYLRTTLPGPLVETRGTKLIVHWSPGSDRRSLVDVETSRAYSVEQPLEGSNARLWIAHGDSASVLLVFSLPIRRVEFSSNRHWIFHFAKKGARALFVPFLKEVSVKSLKARRRIWQELLINPPLECREDYSFQGDRLKIRQTFSKATWAPLPISWNTKTRQSLVELPKAETLIPAIFGDYRVVKGSQWKCVIDTRWMRAKTRITRTADEGVSLPEELAYAGDWTWDERTPLDQLLSWRTWAPLLQAMPEDEQKRILARIDIPEPEAFRNSVLSFRESVTGRVWARDRTAWAERGDCAYDPDWYSGLSLSGLAKAAESESSSLAGKARETGRRCRKEREWLTNYFEIHHDWMLGTAWSDPRGLLWLPDCCHNGMEGLLGEARLCEKEGRKVRAQRLRYLAAKTAVILFSCLDWPEEMAGFSCGIMNQPPGSWSFLDASDDKRFFGVNAISMPGHVYAVTAPTKNPYVLAGHFPEYHALLKLHGPLGRLRELVKIWEKEIPQRYTDWIAFYLGADWERKFAARDQEARVQAAVFYHLAPEVCFRLWVLNENPREIERRYGMPLNRAEQILLQAQSRLELPA